MSYPTHLIKVNSRFYYKIKVPSDLCHLFPCKFIKKSLHTNELNAAKTLLRYCEFKSHNAFALLRTNTLEAEHMQQIVHSLLPAPRAIEAMEKSLLTNVIATYTSEKQTNWSDKTKFVNRHAKMTHL